MAYNKLTLADGTELENSSCGFAGRNLWCWIGGKTMAECFAIFSDPEKTKEINIEYYEKSIIYKGFTDFVQIRKGTDVLGNETVDVNLTWPEGGEHSIEEVPKDGEE